MTTHNSRSLSPEAFLIYQISDIYKLQEGVTKSITCELGAKHSDNLQEYLTHLSVKISREPQRNRPDAFKLEITGTNQDAKNDAVSLMLKINQQANRPGSNYNEISVRGDGGHIITPKDTILRDLVNRALSNENQIPSDALPSHVFRER